MTLHLILCRVRSTADGAVPPGGLIYIVDKTSYAILEKFSIKRILFCAGGEKQTASLGFTTVLETEETDGAGPAELFECHVFDFPAKDKMDLAMAQIAASFGNFDQSDEREGGQMDALRYDFEVSIAVCEHDPTTGKWSHCPFFKGTFKLRSTTGRLQFTFTLTQTSKQSLLFDSGFSVSIGKTLSVEAAQTDELRSEAFIAMQMVSSAQVGLIQFRTLSCMTAAVTDSVSRSWTVGPSSVHCCRMGTS